MFDIGSSLLQRSVLGPTCPRRAVEEAVLVLHRIVVEPVRGHSEHNHVTTPLEGYAARNADARRARYLNTCCRKRSLALSIQKRPRRPSSGTPCRSATCPARTHLRRSVGAHVRNSAVACIAIRSHTGDPQQGPGANAGVQAPWRSLRGDPTSLSLPVGEVSE